MKRILLGVAGKITTIGIILITLSCYPDNELTISELDLVVTMHDDQVDFSQFQTFAIPDSVIRIDENGDPDLEPGDFDQEILDQIILNMENLGYVRELNPTLNPPDLVILPLISLVDAYIIQTYPMWPYWGWWGGWYPGWGVGGGWYPGYPYPPGGTITSYSIGTILIDILDPTSLNSANQELPSIWLGVLNGLASGSNIEQRIIVGIDQAFDQSPYLGAN